MTEQPVEVEPAMLTVPTEWEGSQAPRLVWPQAPLPYGTDLRTWARAATLSGLSMSALLAEKVTVQSAAYEEAVRVRAADAAAETTAAVLGVAGSRRPTAAEILLGAEKVTTTALCHLQDGLPSEAMHLLLAAAHQVSLAVQEIQDEQENVEGL